MQLRLPAAAQSEGVGFVDEGDVDDEAKEYVSLFFLNLPSYSLAIEAHHYKKPKSGITSVITHTLDIASPSMLGSLCFNHP